MNYPPPPPVYFSIHPRHLVSLVSLLVFAILCLHQLSAQPILSQNSASLPSESKLAWYQGFFFQADFQSAIPVAQLADIFTPALGFRAAIGYSWQNWSLSLDSGMYIFNGTQTMMHGTAFDPIIRQLIAIPLTLSASYDFVFFNRLYISPKLGAGILFTRSAHYKSVIHLLQQKKTITNDWGFVCSAQLQIGFAAIPDSLVFFISGGVDLLPESTVKAVPIPFMQAGIKLYPWRVDSFVKKHRAAQQKAEQTPQKELPIINIRR